MNSTMPVAHGFWLRPGNGRKVIIQQGSILDFKGDAIVNSTNSAMDPDGGLDKAVVTKGGADFAKACLALAPLEWGTAKSIPVAGKFKTKNVIHVAVKPSSTADELQAELGVAYRAALSHADSLALVTVGFPAIGTGAHKADIELAATAALEALASVPVINLQEIHFVIIDDPIYNVFLSTAAKKFHKVMDLVEALI